MRTAIVATAALLALAGCSSSDSATQSTPAASDVATAPVTAEPSATVIKPVPAPTIVSPGDTKVTANVNQAIVFKVGAKPARWKITTDNPEVLKVQPGGKDGDATFNPGATALAAGTATVTLTDSQGEKDTMEYTVVVKK